MARYWYISMPGPPESCSSKGRYAPLLLQANPQEGNVEVTTLIAATCVPWADVHAGVGGDGGGGGGSDGGGGGDDGGGVVK